MGEGEILAYVAALFVLLAVVGSFLLMVWLEHKRAVYVLREGCMVLLVIFLVFASSVIGGGQ